MDEVAIRSWIDRARAGDADAFAALFRCFRPDVERLCARLLGSADEAEDAASEAFLRSHGALDGYDSARPFRPWLLGIAAHHCVDRLRRRSTERRLFDVGELDPERFAAAGPSPLQQRLDADARRVVLAAIGALPDRYRVPLALRYYAELDYDAIGELLEVSRNQVATLLFRAKGRLRDALSEPS